MLRSLVGSEMCIRDRAWYDDNHPHPHPHPLPFATKTAVKDPVGPGFVAHRSAIAFKGRTSFCVVGMSSRFSLELTESSQPPEVYGWDERRVRVMLCSPDSITGVSDPAPTYLLDGKWELNLTPTVDGPHMLVAMVRQDDGLWAHVVGSPRNIFVCRPGSAHSSTSTADGNGLKCVAVGVCSQFYIWANDSAGNGICWGGDEFCVMIQPRGEGESATSFADVYDLCLLYTSDAADEEDSVDLGGARFI
eukprot:TRINITY_DN11293_c0_g1_i2.p1 TRINITY_DN11293_c0_g1~~TRINITY_DN11293_c0_g1_i2.p1  ORF type:complete len:280 (-),score=47.44 TRINITY_DN11293_c0_g1_i2:66-809(-)